MNTDNEDYARYKTLIFALQTSWTFVHGSKNKVLLEELSYLLRHGESYSLEVTPELNTRIELALIQAWVYVNSIFVSNTAKNEVARALGIDRTLIK